MAVEPTASARKIYINSLKKAEIFWNIKSEFELGDYRNFVHFLNLAFAAGISKNKLYQLTFRKLTWIESSGQPVEFLNLLLANKLKDPGHKDIFLLGRLFELAGDFSKSYRHYLHCLDCVENDDLYLRFNLFTNLSYICWVLDKPLEQRKNLEDAAHLVQSISALDSSANLQSKTADLYLISRDYSLAINIYKRLLKASELSNIQLAAIHTNLGLGIFLAGQQDLYQSALSSLAQAVQIFQQADMHNEVIRCGILKSFVYFRIGRLERALTTIDNIQHTLVLEIAHPAYLNLLTGLRELILGNQASAQESFQQGSKSASGLHDPRISILLSEFSNPNP